MIHVIETVGPAIVHQGWTVRPVIQQWMLGWSTTGSQTDVFYARVKEIRISGFYHGTVAIRDFTMLGRLVALAARALIWLWRNTND